MSARDPTPVDSPELLAGLRDAALPFRFADPEPDTIVARYRGEGFVALLIVYRWEFAEDADKSDRYPFEHDIAVFARADDGTFAYEGAGGSDWRLGFDRMPAGVPPWLSGFQLGTRFGTFVSGAVSDLASLRRLPRFGADSVPLLADAPTGAFVVRLRDDDTALAEWEAQLKRPEAHRW
jgi:hypothetical protein